MESIFGQNLGTIVFSPTTVIFNLLLAFVFSLAIAWVYKFTHKGLSYSQTFVMTLIIAGVVISAVMMVIGNDIARAFGAFGAFSLIRFRTAIKDARDMGFIFLVLAVGMAVGTNNYVIALWTTVISLLIILVLTKFNFGSVRRFDYILTFSLDTRVTDQSVYKATFDKFLKSSNVLNIKALEEGHVLRLSFSIKFIAEKGLDEFTKMLENTNGISEVNLITAKNDIEY